MTESDEYQTEINSKTLNQTSNIFKSDPIPIKNNEIFIDDRMNNENR